MASVIDTCNLGLAHLGAQSTISSIDPPEGSAYAAHCARFYPTARDDVLAAHPWGFAKKAQALAVVGTPAAGWTYQYARPTDCLRARQVITAASSTPQPFDQANDNARVIWTNTESAVLIYTTRVDNLALWDAGAVVALSYRLAYYLAMAVTRDSKYMAAMLKAYLDALDQAKVGESNESKVKVADYTPAGQAARA